MRTRACDVIRIGPGEEHRHGATPNKFTTIAPSLRRHPSGDHLSEDYPTE